MHPPIFNDNCSAWAASLNNYGALQGVQTCDMHIQHSICVSVFMFSMVYTYLIPIVRGSKVLPCLAMSVDEKLRTLADLANHDLMQFIVSIDLTEMMSRPKTEVDLSPRPEAAPDQVTASIANPPEYAEQSIVVGETYFAPGAVIDVLAVQLLDDSVATRMATLTWFSMLHDKMPLQVFDNITKVAPVLLKSLSDSADKVVRLSLKVLAELSTPPGSELQPGVARPDAASASPALLAAATDFFNSFIVDLLRLFNTERELLEYRGAFIVRHLALFTDPEKVFKALANNLLHENDLDFANKMVQNLNLILLTAPELHRLRQKLKQMESEDDRSFFCVLYKSWCHNPVATFSLCLLTQVSWR